MTTTPLYVLRCFQIGIHIADLEALSIGTVFDLFTEADNDSYPYQDMANQADFDRF